MAEKNNAKMRLDVLLTEKGFFPSRERARAAIMAGEVRVDGVKVDKAGTAVKADAEITVTADKLPYVSRGGLKLKKAIDFFNLDLTGLCVLDIGASTGGFTDCALQHGAAKVYAVDVGYGQLAWSLRQDERVVVLEKTNARYLTTEQIPDAIDLMTCDASFISLSKLLPAAAELMKDGALSVCLIKPQFEAGRDKIGKKGVVRDRSVHNEVIDFILQSAASVGLQPIGLTFSPIRGPEGNIEYLLLMQKGGEPKEIVADVISAEAFASFGVE